MRHLCRTAALAALLALTAAPAARAAEPVEVLRLWYRMVLELVRHTPTYSPPVAGRSFAYLGVLSHEAAASGDPRLVSLAGQLNGLTAPPARDAGAHNEAVVLNAALTRAVSALFANTGPTGQRALAAITGRLGERSAAGVDPEVRDRSIAYGERLADHILAWAATDGGATIENLGFPAQWTPASGGGPGVWVPTSTWDLQQTPLLPAWGGNRPFAMPAGTICGLPPPPAYSEDPGSAFHAEAREVHETTGRLTAEQRLIARFWADDPMLSPTPAGHWASIALQVLEAEAADYARHAEVLARLGVAMGDAFIACWDGKYRYDLLRPVTYIRRTIDAGWEPLLITPPFPEYPSGHSTVSGAAAAVMTALYGDGHAFSDATHAAEGMPVRHYPSFRAAAEEAGISRLYGGIHFRSAITHGLAQGACVGAYAVALRTRAE
jgi:membrane-associated phospholipid phosphatase